MKDPKITIIERKLGKEKAMGQAFKEDGLIEVDPRQKPKDYLETCIHEAMHVLFPQLSERQIILKSKKMTKLLWEIGYRKTSL